MKKIFCFLLAVSVFAVSAVYAEETGPREYTIKKGDTLWGISDSELEDNFLWPKLWNVNPQIENPDLIYPGATITIPGREELMRMPMPPVKPAVKKKKKKAAVIVPKVEKKKYLVSRNLYLTSGWIDDKFPSEGEIISTTTDRSMVGQDESVYIKTDKESAKGDRYLVIRDVKTVRHPETNKKLGHQIRVLGIIKVTGEDNGNTRANVLESFDTVSIGDGLIPFKGVELPETVKNPRTPDNSGYIVAAHMGTSMLGQGDIAFLDKGENDGVRIGDVYSVFVEKPVRREIGKIQVISLRPSTSGAVVTESESEIVIGSRWGNN